MKFFFSQNFREDLPIEEDFITPNLDEDIQKTRCALETAYSGFDNAVEPNLIDSYIFEINALSKRYDYLVGLLALEKANTAKMPESSSQKSPIRALVSHVLG